MIDQNQAGPGMGLSLLKAKGGEWEERTDTIMQILRTICLKCELRLASFSASHDFNVPSE